MLAIFGEVIVIGWFMDEEEEEKDVGDASKEIEVARDSDKVGDCERCK